MRVKNLNSSNYKTNCIPNLFSVVKTSNIIKTFYLPNILITLHQV